tara:strand:- start:23171 stop:23401 length:231 start_codon:yes stop_codon:yes gene_type:complete
MDLAIFLIAEESTTLPGSLARLPPVRLPPVRVLRGYAAGKTGRVAVQPFQITAAFQLANLIAEESRTLPGTLGFSS